MLEKKFYLVEFYTMSDCRDKMLIYTDSADNANQIAKEYHNFCSMISSARLINNPVTELGYFQEYIDSIIAKG